MMSGAITGSSGRQASEARPFSASSGNRTKTAKSGFGEGFSPRRWAGRLALAADKQQHRHHSLEWRGCCFGAGAAARRRAVPTTPPPHPGGGGVGGGGPARGGPGVCGRVAGAPVLGSGGG